MKKTLIRIVSMMVIMSILLVTNFIYSSAANNKIADGTYTCWANGLEATLNSGENIKIDIMFKIKITGGQVEKIKIRRIDGYTEDYDRVFVAEANNLTLKYMIYKNQLQVRVKNKPNKYTWFWYPETGTIKGTYYLDDDGNIEKTPDQDLTMFAFTLGTMDQVYTFTFK